MTEHTDPAEQLRAAARSFDGVSDAYARARPTYPREAVVWLAGGTTEVVLELGAGTGKLTEQLGAVGLGAEVRPPPQARHQAPRVSGSR